MVVKVTNQEQWAEDEAIAAAARRCGMKASEVTECSTGKDGYLRVVTRDGVTIVLVPADEPDENGNTGVLVDPTSTNTPTSLGSAPFYAPRRSRRETETADGATGRLQVQLEHARSRVAVLQAERAAFDVKLAAAVGRSDRPLLEGAAKGIERVIRFWQVDIDGIEAELHPTRPSDDQIALQRGGYLHALAVTDSAGPGQYPNALARVFQAYPQAELYGRGPIVVQAGIAAGEAFFARWGLALPTLDDLDELTTPVVVHGVRGWRKPPPGPGRGLLPDEKLGPEVSHVGGFLETEQTYGRQG